MKKYAIITVIALLNMSNLLAQTDELICYDCRTQTTEIIPSVAIESSKNFENTGWNTGQAAGIAELATTQPAATIPGSAFTDIQPAQLTFNINDYPIRTAVKIITIKNGKMEQLGTSGMFVAPNLVLTCTHCLLADANNNLSDSLLIAPAFDNGEINPLFGTVPAVKYYIPSPIMSDDIALIEINEPIGCQTGWVGIAFYADWADYKNIIGHTFSYPGLSDSATPEKIFNGDTLYYKYGTIEYVNSLEIGYYGHGYAGESGSSMLFSDNQSYYSFGTLNACMYNSRTEKTNTTYTRIDTGTFYAFKNIIDNSVTGIPETNSANPKDFILFQNFPNPFNPSTTIHFSLQKSGHISLKIFNIAGQEIATLVDAVRSAGEHHVVWQAEGLSSGIYLARLQVGAKTQILKLILQK